MKLITAILLFSVFWSTTAPGAEDPGKPNFLIILADDLGFSDPGCYGGEIETPNLDRLAAGGVRFTQFYNTARCWPSRSALMTGYYPQQVRADPPAGRLPAWAATIPQLLKPLGYRCYHSGKWHIPCAPRPVKDGGFDHSLQLEDHDRNFNPRRILLDDVLQPPVAPDSGFYTTIAFADHAIRCLKEHQAQHPGRPFFSYLAFTVPHFPLQALPEDIAKYREWYKKGWEVLRTERFERQQKMNLVNGRLPPAEPGIVAPSGTEEHAKRIGPGEIRQALAWNSLTDVQRELQATKLAIHAAMVDRMDREIGRVLDQIKTMGLLENTVIMFLSDNGASAELLVRGDGHDPQAVPGSAGSFLCLGPGGSSVCNTPFRRHKIWVHEGGIATPLILHWPRGITDRGALRHDPGHLIDLLPTVLEISGAKPSIGSGAPALPGRSLVPAFGKDSSIQRDFLFFHHSGNRALRVGDLKIVSSGSDPWELYDLKTDRTETNNLAASRADKVNEMAARWMELQDQFVKQAGPVNSVPPKGDK
jgi:arylsulfatase A-like enzyme